MRKIITAIIASLSIAGCASFPNGTPLPAPGGTDPGAIVTQVQTIAQQACRFVPTAETVIGLISTFTGTSPFATAASQIADAICAAVNRAGVSRSGKRIVPRVNGVSIRGRFVR